MIRKGAAVQHLRRMARNSSWLTIPWQLGTGTGTIVRAWSGRILMLPTEQSTDSKNFASARRVSLTLSAFSSRTTSMISTTKRSEIVKSWPLHKILTSLLKPKRRRPLSHSSSSFKVAVISCTVVMKVLAALTTRYLHLHWRSSRWPKHQCRMKAQKSAWCLSARSAPPRWNHTTCSILSVTQRSSTVTTQYTRSWKTRSTCWLSLEPISTHRSPKKSSLGQHEKICPSSRSTVGGASTYPIASWWPRSLV